MCPAMNAPSLLRILADVRGEEQSIGAELANSPEWMELQVRKWSAIHDVLVASQIRVSEDIPRDEQWHRVRDHLMKLINEPEINEWLTLQINVASNLASGIHEMRPRKSSPCYEILMEWVVSRKRKMQAVIK